MDSLPKLLRKPAVLEMLGISAATLYRLEKSGGFPARRKLCAGIVGWLETDVVNWINNRLEGQQLGTIKKRND